MRCWWVNHKQTFAHEVGRGYLWCPKRRRDGTRNHFYETIREVRRGDLIFSFAYAHLQAVGPARLPCYSCPRPDEFGRVGDLWDIRGWRVDVDFRKFVHPLRLARVADQVAPLLPQRYSPIQPNGHGNQGAYLAEIPLPLAHRLLELAEPQLIGLLQLSSRVEESSSPAADPAIITEWEDALQQRISGNDSVPETTRRALIQARRGQGLFKQNVAQYERECRITHVDNPIHLIASHIKPWREASDDERLSGGNGLLLTPSIDHLFDRGFISFDDDGGVLVSPVADTEALLRMGVDSSRPPFRRKFNSDQRSFLGYHREEIFLKSAC